MTRPTFSIVVPVYFNEANLPETIPRLLALHEKLDRYRLELVLVDDGSKDNSLTVLREFQQRHLETIKVVKLTRNFGSMAAIQAGFAVATGDCVGMIAADLQDPPELFLDMVGHWERGVKAVFAVRTDREEPLLTRVFANTHYALMRRFALPSFPPGGFDFFVVDRQVVDDINRIREKNTHLMSLIFWLGYSAVTIPYVRRARARGKSRWTAAKKVKLFVDSFVGFSYAPVRLLSMLGLLVALGAFVAGVWVFLAWALNDIPVRGYAPVMILLALTGGLQMIMLGVLGEYLWRTLDEVRRRPPFVIDEIYDGSAHRAQQHASDADFTATRAMR